MDDAERTIAEVLASYMALRPAIEDRLGGFDAVWETADDDELFAELVFCIFTPQSSAERCWETVEELRDNDLLMSGDPDILAGEMCRVRFRFTKAKRLVEARELFTAEGGIRVRDRLSGDPFEVREWLVSRVNGLGYKEASHFLRNVGRGRRLAILDRHILRNLALMDVIGEVPRTMTPKRYLGIEREMERFSEKVGIPMAALDLVLWHRQTGWMFK